MSYPEVEILGGETLELKIMKEFRKGGREERGIDTNKEPCN
jgi:hypothetical protein